MGQIFSTLRLPESVPLHVVAILASASLGTLRSRNEPNAVQPDQPEVVSSSTESEIIGESLLNDEIAPSLANEILPTLPFGLLPELRVLFSRDTPGVCGSRLPSSNLEMIIADLPSDLAKGISLDLRPAAPQQFAAAPFISTTYNSLTGETRWRRADGSMIFTIGWYLDVKKDGSPDIKIFLRELEPSEIDAPTLLPHRHLRNEMVFSILTRDAGNHYVATLPITFSMRSTALENLFRLITSTRRRRPNYPSSVTIADMHGFVRLPSFILPRRQQTTSATDGNPSVEPTLAVSYDPNRLYPYHLSAEDYGGRFDSQNMTDPAIFLCFEPHVVKIRFGAVVDANTPRVLELSVSYPWFRAEYCITFTPASPDAIEIDNEDKLFDANNSQLLGEVVRLYQRSWLPTFVDEFMKIPLHTRSSMVGSSADVTRRGDSRQVPEATSTPIAAPGVRAAVGDSTASPSGVSPEVVTPVTRPPVLSQSVPERPEDTANTPGRAPASEDESGFELQAELMEAVERGDEEAVTRILASHKASPNPVPDNTGRMQFLFGITSVNRAEFKDGSHDSATQDGSIRQFLKKLCENTTKRLKPDECENMALLALQHGEFSMASLLAERGLAELAARPASGSEIDRVGLHLVQVQVKLQLNMNSEAETMMRDLLNTRHAVAKMRSGNAWTCLMRMGEAMKQFPTSSEIYKQSVLPLADAAQVGELIRDYNMMANALAAQAQVLAALHERNKLRDTLKKTLVAIEMFKGPNHPFVCPTLINLGVCCMTLGRAYYAEAIACVTRAVTVYEADDVKKHATELALAKGYVAEWTLRASAFASRSPGNDDIGSIFDGMVASNGGSRKAAAIGLANMAHEVCEGGRPDRGLAMALFARDVLLRDIDPKHALIGRAHVRVSEMYEALERTTEARDALVAATEIMELNKDFNDGEEGLVLPSVLRKIADMSVGLGEHAKAVVYLQRALELLEKETPRRSSDIMLTRLSLMMASVAVGASNTAGERSEGPTGNFGDNFAEFLRAHRRSGDSSEMATPSELYEKANLAFKGGLVKRAGEWAQAGLKSALRAETMNEKLVRQLSLLVARVDVRSGKIDVAEKTLEPILALRDEWASSNTSDDFDELLTLAGCTGEFPESHEFSKLTADILGDAARVATRIPDDNRVVSALLNLSVIFCARDQFDGARQALERILYIQTKLFGDSHHILVATLMSLADVCEDNVHVSRGYLVRALKILRVSPIFNSQEIFSARALLHDICSRLQDPLAESLRVEIEAARPEWAVTNHHHKAEMLFHTLLDAHKDKIEAALVLAESASMYVVGGNVVDGLEMALLAQRVMQGEPQCQGTSGFGVVHVCVGRAHEAAGNLDAASLAFELACRVFEKFPALKMEHAQTQLWLAGISGVRKDFRAQCKFYQAAIGLLSAIQPVPEALERAKLDLLIATERKESEGASQWGKDETSSSSRPRTSRVDLQNDHISAINVATRTTEASFPPRNSSPVRNVQASYLLGMLAYKQKDLVRARQFATEARNRILQGFEVVVPEAAFRVAILMANIDLKDGNVEAAENQVLSLLDNRDELTGAGKMECFVTLVQLGDVMDEFPHRHHLYAESITIYEEAVRLAESLHNDGFILQALAPQSPVLSVTRQNRKHRKVLERMAELLLRTKGPSSHELAVSMVNLADVCEECDDVDAAYDHLQKAVKIFDSAPERYQEELAQTRLRLRKIRALIGDLHPLYVACRQGTLSIVKVLISRGADVNVAVSFGKRDGETSLMAAARGDHVDVIMELIQNGANVNAQDEKGQTALHIAAEHGHCMTLDVLLKYDADKSIKTVQNETAEMCADAHGHREAATLLREFNKNVDATAGNETIPVGVAAPVGVPAPVPVHDTVSPGMSVENGTDPQRQPTAVAPSTFQSGALTYDRPSSPIPVTESDEPQMIESQLEAQLRSPSEPTSTARAGQIPDSDVQDTTAPLGQGNNGYVTQGRWHGKDVALKRSKHGRILLEVVFLQTVFGMANRSHENICRYHGNIFSHKSDSVVYENIAIVFEKLHVYDVRSEMFDDYVFARDVVCALDYLHTTCNVAHGDVTPYNVLVEIRDDKYHRFKLCDFGHATILTSSDKEQKVASDMYLYGVCVYRLAAAMTMSEPYTRDQRINVAYPTTSEEAVQSLQSLVGNSREPTRSVIEVVGMCLHTPPPSALHIHSILRTSTSPDDRTSGP